jgi:abortive infection bacteriophage resistance protein
MSINFSEIEKHISTARLSSYRSLNPSGTTEETIALYYWNKALSSTFFPAIQCLEVTLRNAIHTAAVAHFRNRAWYDQLVTRVANELYANGRLRMNANGQRERSTSEKKLQEAKAKLRRAGKAVTPSGVIAEVSFGFWVSLITSQYEDINNRSKLWPNLTSTVFPNTVGAERNVGFLFNKYNNIRDIRNRLSHHEPLWKSSSSGTLPSAIAYVAAQYEEVMSCIRYISSDRRDYLLQSYMGKEFTRLLSLDAIDQFIGKTPTKAVSVQSFKKDLNLYLNYCDRGDTGYIARGGSLYKIVKV